MSFCRFCGKPLTTSLLDLGPMPLANAYLESEDEIEHEKLFPLHAMVCGECSLVQVEEIIPPERLFADYAYFSSFSTTWVTHAKEFASVCLRKLDLGPQKLVLEVASNDGYLLKHFIDAGVPSVGIEPASNVAQVAIDAGVPTRVGFFGETLARQMLNEGPKADLLVANNVLAHVPDLNDFVEGLAVILKDDGVVSIEFPHLLRMLEGVQFDTIYHEHCSYFSLLTAQRILVPHGLKIFDVEELPTHGGSLRVWATHEGVRPVTARLVALREQELSAGLDEVQIYEGFSTKVARCKDAILEFFSKAQGRSVVAYGAAAKGNTLLNYCQIGRDQIEFVVDRSPHKQGRLLPGSHLPIRDPSLVFETRPDFMIVLPWNLRSEICEQMARLLEWGGRFVFPIPLVEIWP